MARASPQSPQARADWGPRTQNFSQLVEREKQGLGEVWAKREASYWVPKPPRAGRVRTTPVERAETTCPKGLAPSPSDSRDPSDLAQTQVLNNQHVQSEVT